MVDPCLTPSPAPFVVENVVRAASAVLGSGVGFILGGWDGFLYVLTLVMVLDYLTGFANAAIHKRLSSYVGMKGIIKKIMILTLVGVAYAIDGYILGTSSNALRNAVIFFFISNEGLSILENVIAAGVPVPKRLKEALIQLRPDGEEHQP